MTAGGPLISVSVVSHGQGELVAKLLADLDPLRASCDLETIVTRNIREPVGVPSLAATAETIEIVNARPLGFGGNHNQAFARSSGEWFCVVNPDIRLHGNPFPALVECAVRSGASLVAPAVLSSRGEIEDHARRFPTMGDLATRRARRGHGAVRYALGDAPIAVDWVAGMFILVRREVYDALGGFDERFFMYCEDIDLCRRARAFGPVMVCPEASVTHDARRASGRSLRHTVWHLRSFARYFAKYAVQDSATIK